MTLANPLDARDSTGAHHPSEYKYRSAFRVT